MGRGRGKGKGKNGDGDAYAMTNMGASTSAIYPDLNMERPTSVISLPPTYSQSVDTNAQVAPETKGASGTGAPETFGHPAKMPEKKKNKCPGTLVWAAAAMVTFLAIANTVALALIIWKKPEQNMKGFEAKMNDTTSSMIQKFAEQERLVYEQGLERTIQGLKTTILGLEEKIQGKERAMQAKAEEAETARQDLSKKIEEQRNAYISASSTVNQTLAKHETSVKELEQTLKSDIHKIKQSLKTNQEASVKLQKDLSKKIAEQRNAYISASSTVNQTLAKNETSVKALEQTLKLDIHNIKQSLKTNQEASVKLQKDIKDLKGKFGPGLFNPKGYRMVKEKMTKAKAKDHCRDLGLDLAWLDSAKENSFLVQTYGSKVTEANRNLTQHGFWLGGVRNKLNGTRWRWGESGKAWKPMAIWSGHQNWADESHSEAGKDCMEMLGNGKWVAEDCNKRLTFICEGILVTTIDTQNNDHESFGPSNHLAKMNDTSSVMIQKFADEQGLERTIQGLEAKILGLEEKIQGKERTMQAKAEEADTARQVLSKKITEQKNACIAASSTVNQTLAKHETSVKELEQTLMAMKRDTARKSDLGNIKQSLLTNQEASVKLQKDLSKKIAEQKNACISASSTVNQTLAKHETSVKALKQDIKVLKGKFGPGLFNPKVYHVVKEKKTKAKAQENCRDLGLDLALLDSAEENSFLAQTYGSKVTEANRNLTEHGFWLGGVRTRPGSAQWRWGKSGNIWGGRGTGWSNIYRNWANKSQPEDGKDCMVMLGNGKWVAADCNKRLKFICEGILVDDLWTTTLVDDEILGKDDYDFYDHSGDYSGDHSGDYDFYDHSE